MKVDVQDLGACRKELKIAVPQETILPEYEKIVREFTKAAKVPGFRPGKAPRPLVEQRYQSGIMEEARERFVPRFYREAVSQQNVKTVAVVDVRDVSLDKASGLSFTVTVDTPPTFDLPKYKKLPVKGETVVVTDADVEKSYSNVVGSYARYEDVTVARAAKRGDLLKIDFTGQVDGQAISELGDECKPLAQAKDFWALLDEPELMPGMAKGLEGAEAGQERDITVTFADDFRVAPLAGKTAQYHVTVKAMREKVMPEMTEEFLKKEFNVDSVDALKGRIRTSLQESGEAKEKQRRRDEVARLLLESVHFDLPQSIVDQETGSTARNIARRIASQGATREIIEQERDRIIEAAEKTSKDRVKLTYILNAIAEAEKITVADEDVEARIQDMAVRYNVEAARLKAEMEEKDGLSGVRGELRAEKTLDLVLAEAKISE